MGFILGIGRGGRERGGKEEGGGRDRWEYSGGPEELGGGAGGAHKGDRKG